jgi:hypothetical protein
MMGEMEWGVGILTHREHKVTALILLHVDIESAWSWYFLQLALWARSPTEVVKTADNAQHSGQCNPAGISSQTSMGPVTIVDV